MIRILDLEPENSDVKLTKIKENGIIRMVMIRSSSSNMHT
jgi:hypothetical protein